VLFLDQILARFWLILAIFLAVVCNSIHPLASIPAFAMPEAKDQVQNLTFTSGSTIYPSSITSDSAPQSDSYPAATISLVDSIHAAPTTSSSTSSDFCSRSEPGLLLYSTASTSTINDPLVDKRPPRETILRVKSIPTLFLFSITVTVMLHQSASASPYQ
jgi:hypothetical protein